jgi:sugar/nucleoside kinase (ribokinase family)
MTTLQPIQALAYDHIIGTGGIGSGIFFLLKGNETLGREESRTGTLLPYRDYCKQHIILHYISVLLGAGKESSFHSFAIGGVGNDETGSTLIDEMLSVGINTTHVKISDHLSTLFSVCFQYPDHAGGNVTTGESASNDVTTHDIDEFFASFNSRGKAEIVLAAPEVPVPTRVRLLEHGRQRGSLNVTSLLSSEVQEFSSLDGFRLADMLFVNADEIHRIAEMPPSTSTETAVLTGIKNLIAINPSLTIFVTCGAAGIYCYSDKHLEFFPALNVDVVSTAGAGDAFLAGTICGICCGLPLFKKNRNMSALLSTATELGILVATMSVTSQDSIHHGINAQSVFDFLSRNNLKGDDLFLSIFSNCVAHNNTET